MKKNIFITILVLFGLLGGSYGVFAATSTTKSSDAKLKNQLLILKKKQIKTKTNLQINKAQAKITITKVKKQRAQKKATLKKIKATTPVL